MAVDGTIFAAENFILCICFLFAMGPNKSILTSLVILMCAVM